MLFMKYRDFEPKYNQEDYCLGLMIHDDGDVIKWDWTVYKEFSDTGLYEDIANLDVSPYERNESVIKDLFVKFLDNHHKGV